MASLINAFLATGRELLAVERRQRDEGLDAKTRASLSRRYSMLIRRQQDQIRAAVDAGVSWDLVEFSLWLHGQHADSDRDAPTPASVLSEVMRRLGPERFMQEWDAAKAAVAAADQRPMAS